ncbi:MAG: PspA/IM30 family protein [Spirochaetales bacterium]|nr:PspA/IM30 family protein [Spirochaetales bacterium]
MGIFKRAKDIFTANVNSMLDHAENPEAMINQIVRELEVAISDLKCSCANKVAEKKSLERRIKDLEGEIARWNERAELAINNGKDDLAKEALREKNIASEKNNQLVKDSAKIDVDVDSCKDQVMKLEEKLVEMVNKKKDLLTRAERAEERNYTNTVINKASGVEILEKFSRFESKIERMEAEAEIFGTNSSTQFEDLERDSKVEEELEALKQKLGKGKK